MTLLPDQKMPDERDITWMIKHGLSREEAIKTIEVLQTPHEGRDASKYDVKTVQDAEEFLSHCSNNAIWKYSRNKEYFQNTDNDDDIWQGEVTMKQFKSLLLKEREKRGFTGWWKK